MGQYFGVHFWRYGKVKVTSCIVCQHPPFHLKWQHIPSPLSLSQSLKGLPTVPMWICLPVPLVAPVCPRILLHREHVFSLSRDLQACLNLLRPSEHIPQGCCRLTLLTSTSSSFDQRTFLNSGSHSSVTFLTAHVSPWPWANCWSPLQTLFSQGVSASS